MSLYLSLLHLNHRSSRVRRDLASDYELHRTLMRAFPTVEEGGPGRVLWRADTDRQTGAVKVLVQSAVEPEWSKLLSEHPDYLAGVGLEGPKRFEPSLSAGQRLVFRLRANPTVKRDGKRCGLYGEGEQLAWLRRKGDQCGFAVVDARALDEGNSTGTATDGQGRKHALKLLAVRFDGMLEVTNPMTLRDKLEAGIGSGKGVGFGLLSLARAR